jgi:hypothetical protein
MFLSYDENKKLLGFIDKNGNCCDKNGNSISAPSGYGGFVPSSDSSFHTPLFDASGNFLGWGSGTDFVVNDSDPDPDPDDDPDNPKNIFTIPERINQRVLDMMDSVGSALGIERLKEVLQLSGDTSCGEFCIDKPFSDLRFRGRAFVPEIKVCLDLDELSQELPIQMIRMVLLFMVFFIFVSSVFNVLLRF